MKAVREKLLENYRVKILVLESVSESESGKQNSDSQHCLPVHTGTLPPISYRQAVVEHNGLYLKDVASVCRC
jgi:hypothetical protein